MVATRKHRADWCGKDTTGARGPQNLPCQQITPSWSSFWKANRYVDYCRDECRIVEKAFQ